MRRLPVCLSLIAILSLSIPALGEICAIDQVPAATLLLPYFGVDLDDLAGARSELTTLYVRNINVDPEFSGSPAIAHVTLWTDMSINTLSFDVYLTGYDVHPISLNEVFAGNIPGVVSTGADCEEFASETSTVLSAAELADLQNAHIGEPVEDFGGLCAAQPRGDRVARGYLTIDSVDRCSDLSPRDAGYFGPEAIANNRNTLTGDYQVVSNRPKYLEVAPLVAIEASSTDERVTTSGNSTFYGRYVDFEATDNREPLAYEWAVPYSADRKRAFSSLTVWRDTWIVQDPFSCGQQASVIWYPLAQDRILAFDESENPFDVLGTPFPAETQEVRFGGPDLKVPFDRGWMYLDLKVVNTRETAIQSYVAVRHKLGKNSMRGRSIATALTSACTLR